MRGWYIGSFGRRGADAKEVQVAPWEVQLTAGEAFAGDRRGGCTLKGEEGIPDSDGWERNASTAGPVISGCLIKGAGISAREGEGTGSGPGRNVVISGR